MEELPYPIRWDELFRYNRATFVMCPSHAAFDGEGLTTHLHPFQPSH